MKIIDGKPEYKGAMVHALTSSSKSISPLSLSKSSLFKWPD